MKGSVPIPEDRRNRPTSAAKFSKLDVEVFERYWYFDEIN
jgi:hypothetical protein